eukprot:1114961-Prymnesium_polylepis.1
MRATYRTHTRGRDTAECGARCSHCLSTAALDALFAAAGDDERESAATRRAHRILELPGLAGWKRRFK